MLELWRPHSDSLHWLLMPPNTCKRAETEVWETATGHTPDAYWRPGHNRAEAGPICRSQTSTCQPDLRCPHFHA
eukprot:1159735-Pelagomonas_calceolata.AAC.4